MALSSLITTSPITTVQYGSSLRATRIEQTLERAARMGSRLGITRVTEITRLDRVGIPVFAAIRPAARYGSLCVTAGKGVTSAEACASAWMEAIEFALAEPGASPVEVIPATARDVLDGRVRKEAILDFCPLLGVQIPLDAPLPCVAAEDLQSPGSCLVPAELVFLPAAPAAPERYFAVSSNGLASGNTLLEASVHGLAELIERDILSFHYVTGIPALVREETLPPTAVVLAAAIRAAGLNLSIRALQNPFNLPCFEVCITDPENQTPFFINGGSGCHPHREIALVRALCEAAQSRLSVIHGGRDDLEDHAARFRARDAATQAAHARQLLAKVSAIGETCSYEAMPDHAAIAPDLQSVLEVMLDALSGEGLHRICRICFTAPTEELQVVRMIVPGLEEFAPPETPRVGKRLRDYVEAGIRSQ